MSKTPNPALNPDAAGLSPARFGAVEEGGLTPVRHVFSRRVVWGVAIAACLYILGLMWGWHLALQQQQRLIRGETAPVEDLYFLDTDAYYWISFAREMLETRNPRIRFTNIDNAPLGRAVHWSQPVAWFIAGFGAIYSLVAGIPIEVALPYAAMVLNPLLLMLTVVSVVLVLGRNDFPWVACWAVCALISLTAIVWDYHPFRPDHHSLHVLFAFMQILLLAAAGMGWVVRNAHFTVTRNVRRRFLLAGVCGGLGLWVGATITFFVVGALAAGILIFCLLLARPAESPDHAENEEITFEPNLWRLWGWAGSITGLFLYLVEYFPAHMEMRLEVNHPLYVLAFLACGELLARVTAWRFNAISWTTAGILITLAAAACALALPVILLIAPSSWHHMQHEYMQRLHLFIAEFRTVAYLTDGGTVMYLLREYGALLLGFPLALWLSDPDRARKDEWFVLWTAFIVALCFLILTLWQKRWEGIFAAFLVLLLVVEMPILWRSVQGRRLQRRVAILFMALLAAQPLYLAAGQWRQLAGLYRGEMTIQSVAVPIMHMDRAARIGKARDDRDWRFLAEPELVGSLYYFAGVRGVVSLYWENLKGLKAATDFFTDTGEYLVARSVAAERGLTHVMISATEKMAHDFYHIRYGHYDEEQIARTLAARMYHEPETLPDWLIPEPDLQAVVNESYHFRDALLPIDAMLVFRIRL